MLVVKWHGVVPGRFWVWAWWLLLFWDCVCRMKTSWHVYGPAYVFWGRESCVYYTLWRGHAVCLAPRQSLQHSFFLDCVLGLMFSSVHRGSKETCVPHNSWRPRHVTGKVEMLASNVEVLTVRGFEDRPIRIGARHRRDELFARQPTEGNKADRRSHAGHRLNLLVFFSLGCGYRSRYAVPCWSSGGGGGLLLPKAT